MVSVGIKFALCLSMGFTMACAGSARAVEPRAILISPLEKYVIARTREFDRIGSQRRQLLERLSDYVVQTRRTGESMKLTFICTHNSRRSHLSQIWAKVAATYYRVKGIETFSGGTESTAFNPRAVSALERAGMEISVDDRGKSNPKYSVVYASSSSPAICFSKVYSSSMNPAKDFCAVMTCSDADKNCPVVAGASMRIAIPFVDPKVSDGTDKETETYDERCAQIAREMLYVFSRFKN